MEWYRLKHPEFLNGDLVAIQFPLQSSRKTLMEITSIETRVPPEQIVQLVKYYKERRYHFCSAAMARTMKSSEAATPIDLEFIISNRSEVYVCECRKYVKIRNYVAPSKMSDHRFHVKDYSEIEKRKKGLL